MKKRGFRFAAVLAAAFLMMAGQSMSAYATSTLVIPGGGPEESLLSSGPAGPAGPAGETVPETAGGAAGETMAETAGETAAETAGETVAETAGETAAETAAQTVTPGNPAGTPAGAGTDGTQVSPAGSAGPATPAVSSGALSLAASISSTGSTISMDSLSSGTGQQASAKKPEVAAQGAVLYDATHDRFLFEKNADTKLYPASITKVMTALLVSENLGWEDTVTFSESAVTNLEAGAVTLKIGAGDTFTVRDLMYGLWLRSANEVANGLAEKISGSVPAFAEKMNQKAASLGCTNTHFVNPNGLNNSAHVTTARDMARITNAAFNNDMVRKVASTPTYTFPATSLYPEPRTMAMGHKMLNPANSQHYDGFVGGKTGYTSKAGNTLVSVAERNGVRLVAVVLKCSGTHYTDTKKLFDYGFASLNEARAGTPAVQVSYRVAPGGNITGGRWVSDGSRWRFLKSNDAYAGSESLRIDGQIYSFGADGYMLSGWQQIGGGWYHFRDSGELHTSRWLLTDGGWRYVDENGAMMTSGVTPDGYTVGADGIWIQ